jgi:hypothetical protein
MRISHDPDAIGDFITNAHDADVVLGRATCTG